jgi:hypothetical protein
MRIRLRRSGALLGGLLLALVIAAPIALAYEGVITAILVETNPPGLDLRCPGGTNLTATLVASDEETDISNIELTWTVTGGGRLQHSTTTTNESGVSHNVLNLGTDSTSGDRVVTVTTADGAHGSNTFSATCAEGGVGGVEHGAGGQTPPFTGLPNTETLPGGTTDVMPFALIIGLAVLFATIGMIPRLRRRLTP